MTCNFLRFTLSGILLLLTQKIIPVQWINSMDAKDENEVVRKDEESQLLYLDNHVEVSHQLHTSDNALMAYLDQHVFKNNSSLKWGIILGESFSFSWSFAFLSLTFLLSPGIVNFFGSGFQQWALTYISASKVSFLAGFDLFITPLIGLAIPSIKHFHEQETKGVPSYNTWVAIFISFIGVFFLSGSKINDLSIGFGEFLTIVSAFFWSFHIIYTDVATNSVNFNSLKMMTYQMFVVGSLSFIVSKIYEDSFTLDFLLSIFPLLLFLSLVEGLGFVLMAEGQKFSPPTHAALILALEGFFTSLCDYFILGKFSLFFLSLFPTSYSLSTLFFLGEVLESGEIFGCFLMITATIIAKFGIGDIIRLLEVLLLKARRLVISKPVK